MTAFPESSSAETPSVAGNNTTITACSDGPLLVRGDFELLRDDGTPIENKRSTVALCRCGRTGIAQFCYSSHKKKRARAT